jgi:hypothetical protein
MSVVEMRTRRKKQIRQEFDELKDWLTDQEREDFEGAGTATFAGHELRWRNDQHGLVHLVEAAEVVPDIMLAWTLCGIDVSAGADLLEEEEADCRWCLHQRAVANDRRPHGPCKARPAPRSREPEGKLKDSDFVWWRRDEG